ncbi:MAG: nitroreductase family protein [Lachnospiraceae bacterium]|nr:nitroreductase family protein [Lachnospiraceae bacterium]
MMDFNQLILSRRSVRKYTDEPVSKAALHSVLEAGLLAPSGKNTHSTEFLTVTDRETLEKLSRSRSMGAAFLKNAPAAVIVLGDHDKTDTWVEDGSLAVSYMQLAAVELGLGSCWIQVRNRMADAEKTTEDYIKELLDLPARFSVLSVLALGTPAVAAKAHRAEDADFGRVHEGYVEA